MSAYNCNDPIGDSSSIFKERKHGNYFNLEAKYVRLKESGLTAFIDLEGYKKFVADKEQALETELAKQRTPLPGSQ